MNSKVEAVQKVINYIESHLYEKMYLETIANAVHYSKYYMHRTFSSIVGMTIHEYINRRKLTEAAKLLAFTEKQILEVALVAGYESQQAFSAVFKAMYKKTPNQFREEGKFYPLQNKFILYDVNLTESFNGWENNTAYVVDKDIPSCVDFVKLVVDGLPNFDLPEFTRRLKEYIQEERVLIMKNHEVTVGLMAFNRENGFINFWGMNPQYRKREIEKAFLERLMCEVRNGQKIAITTFREGDKADMGYRKAFKNLGFVEAEQLIEYGYPTQKFILERKDAVFEN